jgi:hypothetical protein
MFFKSFERQQLALGIKDDGLNNTIGDCCTDADRSHADLAPQSFLGLWPIRRVGNGALNLACASRARAHLIKNSARNVASCHEWSGCLHRHGGRGLSHVSHPQRLHRQETMPKGVGRGPQPYRRLHSCAGPAEK